MGVNVQIAGNVCRAPASGHCLVLHNTFGTLTSKLVTLDLGVRYVLSFDLVGNPGSSQTTTSVTTVTLGSVFDHVYTLANGSIVASTEVTQAITVPMAETLDVVFKGDGVSRTDGMVVDNISLAATGVATPEPATPGLLALGLLGGAGAGFARRKGRN